MSLGDTDRFPEVHSPYPEPPLYRCFDCRWERVPDGFWDYDEGDTFVPDTTDCPSCGGEGDEA